MKRAVSLFLLTAIFIGVLSGCREKDDKNLTLSFSKALPYHQTYKDMPGFSDFNVIINDYYNTLIKAYNESDKKNGSSLIFESEASKELKELIDDLYKDNSTEKLNILKAYQYLLSTDYCVAAVRFSIDDETTFTDLRQSIVDMYEYLWDEPT